MKKLNKKISIFTALIGVCGIFAYAQDAAVPPAQPASTQEAVAENPKSAQSEIPSDAKERMEYFRKRREARRAAHAEFANGGGEFQRPRFSRRPHAGFQPPAQFQNQPVQSQAESANTEATTADANQASSLVGGNELLHSLATKNPFVPIGSKSTAQIPEGIALRSIAKVDGKWVFSVTDKSGKTMWLGVGEEIENAPCKIDSFDENAMTARASVAGRQIDLSLAERSIAAIPGKVELVDAIKPRRMIAPHERAKVWNQYATNEQREAANRVWQTARAQGRNYLNREDRRKLFEIERQIQIPENANQGGGGQPPAPPPMPPR